MAKPYQVLAPTAPVPAPDDVLEAIVREGARKMLQSALEKEVDEFLGRGRYERATEQRGYRNGHLPKRSIGVGMGAVEVSLPRVSDVPKDVISGVGITESVKNQPTGISGRGGAAASSSAAVR